MNTFNLFDYEEIKSLDKFNKTILVKRRSDGELFVRKEVAVTQGKIYEQLLEVSNSFLCKTIGINSGEKTFILEEYIDGKTINNFLTEGYIFSEEEVLNYSKQICKGLIVLHSKNIIHRDIKPSNIIIDPNNRVKIIDFGIARIANNDSKDDTIHMGTEGFAPPEQFGFDQSGQQADIYSLGVLMNVMLTKKLPKEELSEGKFKWVITKCTEIDKKFRYKNIVELLKALESGSLGKKPKDKVTTSLIISVGIAVVIATIVLAGFLWFTKEKSNYKGSITSTKSITQSEKTTTMPQKKLEGYLGQWASPDGVNDKGVDVEIIAINNETALFSIHTIEANPPYSSCLLEKVNGTVNGNVIDFFFSDDGEKNSGKGTLTLGNDRITVNVELTKENPTAKASLAVKNHRLERLSEWMSKYGM